MSHSFVSSTSTGHGNDPQYCSIRPLPTVTGQPRSGPTDQDVRRIVENVQDNPDPEYVERHTGCNPDEDIGDVLPWLEGRCEWRGCGREFRVGEMWSGHIFNKHAEGSHYQDLKREVRLTDERVACLWTGCDAVLKFSSMKQHVELRHLRLYCGTAARHGEYVHQHGLARLCARKPPLQAESASSLPTATVDSSYAVPQPEACPTSSHVVSATPTFDPSEAAMSLPSWDPLYPQYVQSISAAMPGIQQQQQQNSAPVAPQFLLVISPRPIRLQPNPSFLLHAEAVGGSPPPQPLRPQPRPSVMLSAAAVVGADALTWAEWHSLNMLPTQMAAAAREDPGRHGSYAGIYKSPWAL